MTTKVGMPTPNVQSIAKKNCRLMSEATQQAMIATQSTNKCDAIYVASIGIMSAVQVLASLLGSCPEGKDKSEPHNYVNKASLLTAGLLCARIGFERTDEGDVCAEFSPMVLVESADYAAKILGENIDSQLDQEMIGGARQIVADGSAGNIIDLLKSGKMSMFSSSDTRH